MMSIWTDPNTWHWLGRAFTANFLREALYYLVAALLLWLVVHKWLHKLVRNAHKWGRSGETTTRFAKVTAAQTTSP